MFGILLISCTSAAFISLGIFKAGDNVSLIQLCDDCTYNNITSIIYPNGTIALGEAEMTKDGTQYNYTYLPILEIYGTYTVNGFGDEGGADTVWAYTFEVTYMGQELTNSQAILYLGLLGLLILIMGIIFFGIGLLPNKNTTDEEGKIMSISYLKYLRTSLWFVEWILFIAMMFISSNLAIAYLGTTLISSVFFKLFYICFALTPLIVILWMIHFFVSFFHDKQFQALLNRGFFPQGKI